MISRNKALLWVLTLIYKILNCSFVQINLYLLSRILYGLAKLAVKRGYVPAPKGEVFPWFAAIVWGIVLWLFEYEQDTLQPSLKSSMTYLYHDSNRWNNFKNFLIYNKWYLYMQGLYYCTCVINKILIKIKFSMILKMTAGDVFILRILCPITFDCNFCCNMWSQYLFNVYMYCNSDQAFGNLYKSVINTRTNRSCLHYHI